MENITDQYRALLPDNLFLALGEIGPAFPVDILSPVEREEYNTFSHRRRRNEFLSTRGLIKEFVADLGLDEAIFEIEKDDLGKPFGMYQNRRYNLSLAHTGQKVICGLSQSIPLGVDIEPTDRNVNERLRDRIMHPVEKKELKEESLLRLWTLKEALVKLQGKGLRTNLNQIKLTPLDKQVFTGIFDNEKRAKICSFKHCNHWIAVAFYQEN
ncbi:4'-phosphopantetheinyl transferase superfamily protein [Aliifodinibius sp. S!AR15-10]|uniref:4'-phosphopantetheinyl transferase family protein n=1 Tax=Aliifodinibius sp. S!AR15-10 TaxID=2950437 RepID=UPI00285A7F48|nr:4'-phosphopantetheinyl transferase superfamily protein [Aliifodinibius sp. S!AR15-10]MDR8391783.1 4'-phosphopantetheinyl transferase superfamily protein [Aliifodinibius sp. S!AR15-10]